MVAAGAPPIPSPIPSQIDEKTIGEDVPLLEGIRTTRAIRRLRPDRVPPALIRKVVEAGTFAPSGGNRQPWSFIAVTDPATKSAIALPYRKIFSSYIAPALEAAKAPDYPEHKRRNLEGSVYLAEHMAEVPVLLFVAGWTRRGAEQTQALFPAIQNVLLACRAVGLGACLTTLHTAFREEVDSILGLPPSRPSAAMIPIGWPLIPYKRPVRGNVDDCLYWERFEDRD
ncbi:MAG: nitroreductase [Hyphomicrobiaceae bacterium]|jgi:nitroreductase